MKTQVNRHRVGTIEEFADEYGLTLIANETNQPADSDERFEAHLSGGLLWICNAGFSVPSIAKGIGNTPEEAIADYASYISGELFIRSSDGKRITVWRLDEKPEESPEERIASVLRKAVELSGVTIEGIAKTLADDKPNETAKVVRKMLADWQKRHEKPEEPTSTQAARAETDAIDTVLPEPEIAPCPVCGAIPSMKR